MTAEATHMSALPVRMPRSPLGVVSGVTIVLYVATSTLLLSGSLRIGDLWMLVAGVVILLSQSATRGILRFLLGNYGVIALALTGCMLVGTLNSRTFIHSLAFVAQAAFILWVLVPVVAVGVARMTDPLRLLRAAGVGYLAVYAVGLLLLFGAGSDAILYQSAIGRVFQWPVTHVFQLSLMAVAAAGIAVGTSGRMRDLLLLLLSFIPILLNASRTGFVGFGVLAALGLAASMRRIRRLPWVMGGLLCLVGAGTALVTSGAFQDLWQIRVLSAASFLEDDIRLNSIRVSWGAIRGSVMTMLFGDGWGTSGGEMVVHNVILQVWHEGGLFVLLAMMALLALPVVWALLRPPADAEVRLAAVMIGTLNMVFWMLNALSVERVYWLAYAVALGLAYRLHPGTGSSA